jgi:hypothetical protein
MPQQYVLPGPAVTATSAASKPEPTAKAPPRPRGLGGQPDCRARRRAPHGAARGLGRPRPPRPLLDGQQPPLSRRSPPPTPPVSATLGRPESDQVRHALGRPGPTRVRPGPPRGPTEVRPGPPPESDQVRPGIRPRQTHKNREKIVIGRIGRTWSDCSPSSMEEVLFFDGYVRCRTVRARRRTK